MQIGPVENAKLRGISLGAGVQSSVMALLAARGLITPMPDFAIFADTQWEPASVYAHLEWLETQLPFPVIKVTAGDLRKDILDNPEHTQIPWHIRFADGKIGLGRRQCTADYKLLPIMQEFRKQLGLIRYKHIPKGTVVEQWIGISVDEIERAKDSRWKWIISRFPLLELQMTRVACQTWFEREYSGKVLPKSSCSGCPLRSNAEWRALRDRDPEAFAEAIVLDGKLRDGKEGNLEYMHRSLVPLEFADLKDPDKSQFSLWEMECEGMCGV